MCACLFRHPAAVACTPHAAEAAPVNLGPQHQLPAA